MRHSTRQISKMLGVQVLLSAVLGDQSSIGQVTSTLVGLKFSRKHETEADERSVKYLCPTDYNAGGGAGFFQKISELGGDTPPEFLSTHPNPDDRIENFQNLAITYGCVGERNYQTELEAMVAKLP